MPCKGCGVRFCDNCQTSGWRYGVNCACVEGNIVPGYTKYIAAMRPGRADNLLPSSVTSPRAFGTPKQYGHVIITLALADVEGSTVRPKATTGVQDDSKPRDSVTTNGADELFAHCTRSTSTASQDRVFFEFDTQSTPQRFNLGSQPSDLTSWYPHTWCVIARRRKISSTA